MQNTVTIIIDELGDVSFLLTEAAQCFVNEDTDVARASHVEPDSWLFRFLFHRLRRVFGDKGRMSEFTRHWPCLWRVNTQPVGGPILPGRWRNRKDAIDAEVAFLNRWFEERPIGN